MNIEKKYIGFGVEEYLPFGWEHIGRQTTPRTVSVGPNRHVHRNLVQEVLQRDKDMENYRLIAALETKYFALKNSKKYYKPIDGGWCFIGFVFFILPGLIYLIFKIKQKEAYAAHNEKVKMEMDFVAKEAQKLL